MRKSLSHFHMPLFLFSLFTLFFLWTEAHAAPTERILFQGELKDAQGGLINGLQKMRFRIFENKQQVWQKVYSDIEVENGKFSIVLEDNKRPLRVNCAMSPHVAVEIHNSSDFEDFSPMGRIEAADATRTKPILNMASLSMNLENVVVEPISEKCKCPPGPRGPRGYQGIQGPVGPRGSVGPKGEVGDVGPQGPQGIQGEQGIPSPIGAIGPAGVPGPMGPPGPIGATGSSGFSGYETETESGTFQTAKRKTVTLTCEAGKKMISGGVHISHTTANPSNLSLVAEKVHVSSSYPSSTSAWTVTLWSQDQSSSYIYTVYAVCATLTP